MKQKETEKRRYGEKEEKKMEEKEYILRKEYTFKTNFIMFVHNCE